MPERSTLSPGTVPLVTVRLVITAGLAAGAGKGLCPGGPSVGTRSVSALAHLPPSLVANGPGFGGAGAARPRCPRLLRGGRPLSRLSGRGAGSLDSCPEGLS